MDKEDKFFDHDILLLNFKLFFKKHFKLFYHDILILKFKLFFTNDFKLFFNIGISSLLIDVKLIFNFKLFCFFPAPTVQKYCSLLNFLHI